MNLPRRLLVFSLLACALQPAHAAIQAGDFLFLYAQVLECSDNDQVVDYAEVAADGSATFMSGVTVHAINMTDERVAAQIAEELGKKTGRTPKTLSILVVPPSDQDHLAMQLMILARGIQCLGPPAPNLPPPVEGYNRRLASTS